MSLKILRKNFKILFCIFLILLTFNILVLNYVVKQYSIDVQAFKNKQLRTIYNDLNGKQQYKSNKWGGINLFPDDDDDEDLNNNNKINNGEDYEDDELLQLNTNFIRFSNMRHGKLLINDNIQKKRKQYKKQQSKSGEQVQEEEKEEKEEQEEEEEEDQNKIVNEEIEEEEELYRELESNLIISNLNDNNNLNKKKLKLVIAIPTLPRESGNDHLSSIISSFEEQSKENSPLSGLEIKVLVYNNSPGNHSVFYKLKEHYRYKYTNVFSFIDNTERHLVPENDINLNNKVTRKMKQKNLDISNMLRAINNRNQSDFILVMEDDFPLCSKSVSVLPYLIKKSNLYNRKWDLIRTSVGLNGFVFKGTQIERISNYLEKNRYYGSIEKLLAEWMCGMRETGAKRTGKCNESRRNSIIFRLTLFSHINGESKFKKNDNANSQIGFPQCWYDYSHLLSQNDRFYIKQCQDDDIAPCIQYHPIPSMVTDLTEASSHLNHYLKSRIIVSPSVKRNITLEVSFVQRQLPILYRSVSHSNTIEDAFNFSSAATKHLKQSLKNHQKYSLNKNIDQQYYFSDIVLNDQEDSLDQSSNYFDGNQNLIHGLLFAIFLSITGVTLIILFKRINLNVVENQQEQQQQQQQSLHFNNSNINNHNHNNFINKKLNRTIG